MPQVPYNPVPQVATSDQAAPSMRVGVPPGAFGSGVADAIEGLGKVVSHAGDEIFQRAMALQQLNNETEAREADSKYMIGAGELHANYNSLQGKDAVDAYPKYQKDLEALRKDIRGTMSNDMARKMYDGPSLSTMGRSIFNGAGHAASQNKQWAIGTATSRMSLNAKTIEDNPGDERLFQEKLFRVQADASELAALHGMGRGSPQEQELQLKASSQLWSQRIIGMSRTAPFEAAKFLDANKTQMTQGDYLKADGVVRQQGRAVGAANIANGVYDPTRPLKELEVAAEERAKELAPDDPILAQHSVAALRAKFNQDKYATKQQQLDDVQALKGAVSQGPDGKGVKTEQELLAIPGMAEVIQRLPASERNGIPAYINRFNRARDQTTNDESKLRLNGLFNNPDTREEALNLDLTKEKLSVGDLMKFQDKQSKLRQNLEGDPRVARAVGWMQQSMGAQLEALGVYRRTDSNKDLYDHFRGSVQVGIDTFIEDNKRPPNYKEFMDQIAPRLLQTRDTSWTPLGRLFPTATPFFERENDVKYERFATKMRADFGDKQLAPPSDQEVYKAYVRALYSNLYGKKDKAP